MMLSVDAAGLRHGSGRSAAIASDLTRGGFDSGASMGQPSHAGVAALNGAILNVRNRQAQRIEHQAMDMVVGADAYDATDAQAEGRLAESM